MGGVSTRDFGAREDAVVTDLETEGSGSDKHTLMGLTKGQLQHLGNILDAVDLLATAAKQADLGASDAADITSVASLATSQQLLAVNLNRKGLMIYNSDANALSVKYGVTATTSAGGRSFVIPSSGLWEMPQPIYTGRIDGIWAADGSGSAEITEW